MPYGQDLSGAARRHFAAAEKLYETTCKAGKVGNRAVAGYLFGLAGELSLKEMMRDSGMTPLPAEQRNDDPFFHHFPTLKTLLLDNAQGRRAGELLALAQQSQLFQYWDIAMRYAATKEIKDAWIKQWRESAASLLNRMVY